MTLTLIPLYLLGNLHCIGMCGPLMLLLAHNPHKWLYFLGRLLSFSLAGLLATTLGLLLGLTCPGIVALLIGSALITFAILQLLHKKLPTPLRKPRFLTTWLAQNRPTTTFAFGFCTILLPCGQTLTVYSALALLDHPLIGLLNGFLFALLTTPSLIAALYATRIMRHLKQYERPMIAVATLLIGVVAIMRGLATYGIVDHLTLPPHIVLY